MSALTPGQGILAAAFLGSGTLHLVRPQIFEPIVPRTLPARRELVLISGVAELVCGLGLLHLRTRPVAGLASAALLVAVFPANLQMTADHVGRARHTRRPGHVAMAAATIARLPLQWPLIRSALTAAKV